MNGQRTTPAISPGRSLCVCDGLPLWRCEMAAGANHYSETQRIFRTYTHTQPSCYDNTHTQRPYCVLCRGYRRRCRGGRGVEIWRICGRSCARLNTKGNAHSNFYAGLFTRRWCITTLHSNHRLRCVLLRAKQVITDMRRRKNCSARCHFATHVALGISMQARISNYSWRGCFTTFSNAD